ncbi:MAG TPA: hypothetical protein VF771_12680 [Longimicrobiaceae bacterium]
MASDIKRAAHELIDGLPDDATWDDVMYAVSVRQSIEAGLAEADAGLVISNEEFMRSLGLDADGEE